MQLDIQTLKAQCISNLHFPYVVVFAIAISFELRDCSNNWT